MASHATTSNAVHACQARQQRLRTTGIGTDYGCAGGLKNLQPCYAGGVNIISALGMGLFWCQMLAWVCVPLSLYLLLAVWSRHSRYQRYLNGEREPD